MGPEPYTGPSTGPFGKAITQEFVPSALGSGGTLSSYSDTFFYAFLSVACQGDVVLRTS